ncbi:MAG: recombination mediator RecR [Clostridia bacterium]
MKKNEPIERLIASFKALPGVGAKTAQRYAFYILTSPKEVAVEFSESIMNAKENVFLCKQCGNFSSSELCEFCTERSEEIICVVKDPKDIIALEKVKNFSHQYHVLHGTISPLENRGPNDIRIKELLARISKGKTKEVIMATNPDVEGDATAMYISKLLKPLGIKVTRLAQGISMGSDIEFADELTLTRAIESRREI